ncbi:hypothetical protein DFH09DRAFT_1287118 [Mycena vulgaris]|nr:hypothetical protein DFH09DRAFT_1287118 [Mycena vulgaris]
MGAKFLCCLPLRLGVLIISFLQFLVSGFAAVLLTVGLVLDYEHKDGTPRIRLGTKIITIFTIFLHVLVALICLTGFIGGLRKMESHVRMFSDLLTFSLIFHAIGVTANLIFYFVDKGNFRTNCIEKGSPDAVCDAPSKLPAWAVIVSAIIPIVFQAYGVYIVWSYDKLLRVEAMHLHKMHLRRESFSSGPELGEESHSLTNPPQAAGYPYADKSHSFGAGQADHV